MKKQRRTFPKKLVKEYGEQTYRDRRYSGKSSYEDAAWSSVYVAEGCGQIESEEEKRFHAAIVKYAKTTRFPKNFL